MADAGVQHVRLVCANTDRQALSRSQAKTRVQIGEKNTHRAGAQAPGRRLAQRLPGRPRADRSYLKGGRNMVFVTAGMGGGTGAGAAPGRCRVQRIWIALTIGIVTKAVRFCEGQAPYGSGRRALQAAPNWSDPRYHPDRLKLVRRAAYYACKRIPASPLSVLRQGVQSVPTSSDPGHRRLD